MAQRSGMTRELAETVAIQALTFIAEEPERLGRFLALTGIGPESLRDAAREPNFLLGVLDHLAADEALLREFAKRKRDCAGGTSPRRATCWPERRRP